MLACGMFLATLAGLDAHSLPPPSGEQPPAEQPSIGPTEEDQADFDNARAVVEEKNTKLSVRITFAAELLKADWPEALQVVLELLDNSSAAGTCVPICMAIAGNGERCGAISNANFSTKSVGRMRVEVFRRR